VGNASNLILDPTTARYYLAGEIITTLPVLSEYIGQERGLGMGMAAGRMFPAQKTNLILLRGKVLAADEAKDKGFDFALRAKPDLKPRLDGPIGRCGEAVRAFQDVVQKEFIEPSRVDIEPQAYFPVATRAVDTVFELYDRVASELDAILAAHIAGYVSKRNLVVAVSLAALFIAVFLFIAFHISVKFAVLDMVRLAESLSSGDSSVRLKATSHDELGDLARYLNKTASRVGQLIDMLNLRRKYAETIIASMPVGIIVLRGNLIVVRTNRALRETFGLEESAAAGRPLEDVLPVAGLREAALDVIATGMMQHAFRLEAIGGDGARRPLRVTIVKTRLAEGEGEEGKGEEQYGALIVVVEDVSEEERLKGLADAAERSYRNVVDNAVDGIVVMDQDGRISSFNRAAERLFGYERAQALGRPVTMLIPEKYRQAHEEGLARYIRTRRPRMLGSTASLEGLRKNGAVFPIELSVSAHDVDGKTVFTGIVRDVTERLRMEQALRNRETQLRQSQKMEAVGRLAGGVAHDFNNLLTTILSCSDFLLRNLKPDDANRADVLEIESAGNRAAALTKQILAFGRKQMLQSQRMDLNAMVNEMQGMLRRLIGEDIELSILPCEKPLIIDADRGQAGQVIMNLVVNARDAMPNGGKIVIETAPVDFDEEYVHRHGAIPPGAYAALAVSDTGCGMSEAVQSHLFEPFFTTKETGKGTGLGLATVHGIIAQSRGHVTVYSKEGRGTTFKIYLPRSGGQAENGGSAAQQAELPKGSGTVLLVEDEASVREVARRALALNGFTVIATGDPLEALAVCGRLKEPIRLLITDMIMPKLNGLELARKVKAMRPDIQTLYMSGYTEHAVLEQGGKEMEGAFLQKPFMPRAFLEKIHEILRA